MQSTEGTKTHYSSVFENAKTMYSPCRENLDWLMVGLRTNADAIASFIHHCTRPDRSTLKTQSRSLAYARACRPFDQFLA